MIPGYEPFQLGKTKKEKEMPIATKHKIFREDVSVANYVYETRNYDLFVLNRCNRDLRPASNLTQSIVENGLIDSGAIHVRIIEDGKLEVMRGHHRFSIASKLGFPIKFIIDDADISIFELEADTRSAWNQYDFIAGYAKSGNDNYQDVVAFAKAHGYSVVVSANLLSNQSDLSGNKKNAIFTGKYKVTTMDLARRVARITDHCSECGIQFATNSAFVFAIASVCLVAEFDDEKFIRRVSAHPAHMRKCGTKLEYMREIEDLYNSRGRIMDKIDLVLRAQKAIAKRNPTKK